MTEFILDLAFTLAECMEAGTLIMWLEDRL